MRRLRFHGAVAAALASTALTGCSYSYVLAGRDALPVVVPAARERRVAIVMAQIPPELEVTAAGYHHHYRNFRALFERVAYTALADAFDTVRFVSQRPESGYDLVLYPTLAAHARLGGLFQCSVDQRIQITDGAGRELAAADAHGAAQLPSAEACVTALLSAFNGAVMQALPRASERLALAEAPVAQPAAPPEASHEAAAAPAPRRGRKK